MISVLFNNQPPPAHFLEDLDKLAALEKAQLDAIAAWILSRKRFSELEPDDYNTVVAETGLVPDDFIAHIRFTQYLLTLKTRHQPSEADFDREIRQMITLEETNRERATGYFKQLDGVSFDVFFDSLRRVHEELVLPVVEDVNMVWDIRPVFGAATYEMRPMSEPVDQIYGFTNILMLEVMGRTTDNKKHRAAFQLTEAEFEKLEMAFARARKQLQALRTWTASSTKPDGGR
ncbi:MAG: hypothetical protein JNM66_08525 [Bryobacterales bacterium]|nr:hypothetical protein [Bryobacterales bacterium]